MRGLILGEGVRASFRFYTLFDGLLDVLVVHVTRVCSKGCLRCFANWDLAGSRFGV